MRDRRDGPPQADQPAATGDDPRGDRRLPLPDHADPARRLIVRHVSLRSFRSYASLELTLEPGLVLVTGPNGVGKTNLLEALHVGSQGFSPRTRVDAQLVRFGEEAARVSIAGTRGGVGVETEVSISPGRPKRVKVNGAPVASAEELRREIAALAFTPDRLAVVKGGPIVRRAYLDRMLGRVFPSRAMLSPDYGKLLAQRNTALRLVREGRSSRAAIEPWTRQLASLGAELDRSRSELTAALGEAFGSEAERLGLALAEIRYEDHGLTVEELDARLDRDLLRGSTGVGPHLRDVEILAAGRDLRSYGSQGEQRVAVLALTLAESGLLADLRGSPPLLLLDDVLSELDDGRRRSLLADLPKGGQVIVTATSLEVLPPGDPRPDQVLVVSPGQVTAA